MTGNDAVLLVNQAFWGLFSSDINAVAVELVGDDLVVHVALEHDTPGVREDLDDMVGELEVFAMPENPGIRVDATISAGDPTWEGRRHRLVLLRKP